MFVGLNIFIKYGLVGLLFITTLSSSIVPFPSEPAIVLAATIYNPVLVFVISLIGYVIGGITNYYIGLKGLHNFFVRRSPKDEKKAQRLFDKWGPAVLIIAPWIPFIGDPLLIIAGVLKMRFKKFILYSTIGKIIKILALIMLGELLTPFVHALLI